MSIDIDLTTALDSRITFTRAGTRNYITGGVLTALGTGLPAFESWGGVARGMAIEPGFTNLLTYSEDLSQGAWYKNDVTISAGDTGAGLITAFQKVSSAANTSYHWTSRTVNSIAAGTRQTLSAYVKMASSAPYCVNLRMTQEYNNGGSLVSFRLDGKGGFVPYSDLSIASGLLAGVRDLGGGIFHCWVSIIWNNSGNKDFSVSPVPNASPHGTYYAGATTDAVQVFGMQVSTTNGPCGYVATTASTASQAAESAVFNDTSWLTTGTGTFVIEHDCWTGTLIGSGTNEVLASTASGRTAIAWSGSTSDTVSNGGATTTGTNPTFSGSDVRLLATSSATNGGHIKRIQFYPTRKTVAELQALTAPDVVSTAANGSYRTVSTRNRLPSAGNTTSGGNTTFTARFCVEIGAYDCSELKLDFPNFRFAGNPTGNALYVESCALERETTVAEYVPVYVGGSRSFTVADGASKTVISDAILPGAFTGLGVFPAGLKLWVRIRGSVTTTGHIIPGSRFGFEVGGESHIHLPSTYYSAVDSTGALAYVSGTATGWDYQGYCPILIGKFSSGDPKTVFTVGDSIVEGVGTPDAGSFLRMTVRSLGIPTIEMSEGGRHQGDLQAYQSTWEPYLSYARILIDEFGTNNGGSLLKFFDYWHPARTTYNYDKIIRAGLFPRGYTYNNWQDEANQYNMRVYPGVFPEWFGQELLKYGYIDVNFDPQSIRGTDKSKFLTNGTANYMTGDGVHPSEAGHALMQAEFEPILSALTVTTSVTLTIVQPTGDISAGTWTPSSGTTLWEMVDEPTTPNDSDYISTAAAGTTELALPAFAFPVGSNVVLSVRGSSTTGSTLTVSLKQAGAVITGCTWTQVLTGTDTTYQITLDAGQRAAITDPAVNPVSITVGAA